MTNYVQSQEAGDIYVRPKSIILNNPKDQVKSVTYNREQIVNLKDGNYIPSDLAVLVGNFDEVEMAKTIPLYNPLTMEQLGEKNIGEMVQQLNVWLFSYMVYLDNLQQTQANNTVDNEINQ